MSSTHGKRPAWNVSTGERVLRWSVDVRAMVATGDWTDVEPEGAPAPPSEETHPLHDVAVRNLAAGLAGYDDMEELRGAMASDPRSSAGAHYEARLRELMGPGAEHSPGVPLRAVSSAEALRIPKPGR